MAERLIVRLRREQTGMTLIELLVAATVMAVGVVGLMSIFDGSRHLVTTAEKNDVAAHQAEAEVERILGMPYKAVALTTAPAFSANANDPDHYVGAGGTYQWDQGSSPQPAESLWVDATNGSLQHITPWSDSQSRLSGSIYDYVTLVPNGAATNPTAVDPKQHPAKRVTVAVTVNNPGPGVGFKKPVLVSSALIDPKAG